MLPAKIGIALLQALVGSAQPQAKAGGSAIFSIPISPATRLIAYGTIGDHFGTLCFLLMTGTGDRLGDSSPDAGEIEDGGAQGTENGHPDATRLSDIG